MLDDRLTLREFLDCCDKHGWRFTVNWVERRLSQLKHEDEQAKTLEAEAKSKLEGRKP